MVEQSEALEVGRSPTAGHEEHPAVEGPAQPRTQREQVGHLVLGELRRAEDGRGIDAAEAPALAGASAQRRFDAENPHAPLPLRANVEAEDGIAVPGLMSALDRNGPTAVGVGKCWFCWYHTPPMLPPIGARPVIVHDRGGGGATRMSAAIAGPASIAASPTLPSKNFFINSGLPPGSPLDQLDLTSSLTLARLGPDGCDICATVKGFVTAVTGATEAGGGHRRGATHRVPSVRGLESAARNWKDAQGPVAEPTLDKVSGAPI